MVTVFNVGQGDSFLLQPRCNCRFDEPNSRLLVDTGAQSARIDHILKSNPVIALLTHSHDDHIGGLPGLLASNMLSGLLIPYYMPEITSIYKYVIHHVSTTKMAQPSWSQLALLDTKLLKEGDQLCNHIKILNPPASPLACFTAYDKQVNSTSIAQALDTLAQKGMRLPVEEIINYKTPIHRDNIGGYNQEYAKNAQVFVHQFFITLCDRLRHEKTDALPYHVDTHLQLTANQASIVFMYTHPNHGKWLFTGDADVAVFERLINSGTDISAKYLKVPHHGSRENLSQSTLRTIDPEVAIISHKNRKFGRSLDPHPHHEVIEMLDRQGVRTYYTNPVVKGGMTIKAMACGTQENGLINFV